MKTIKNTHIHTLGAVFSTHHPIFSHNYFFSPLVKLFKQEKNKADKIKAERGFKKGEIHRPPLRFLVNTQSTHNI